MKKTLVACIIMAMAGATLLSAAPQAVEEIVAIVNEDIITLSEYKQQFEGQIQQLKGQNLSQDAYNKQYDFLKKELLNTMITDLLLLQQAKEKNLNVNEELKNNIENIKKENNLTSDEDLRRAVQQTGMTYEQWVNQYRDFLLKQMIMMSEVYRSIVLDDSEVVRYYKQHPDEFTVPTEYKLHAVYLTAENRTPEALEALKAEIGAKLKAGADFAETAAALADPPMKEAKGDLGTLKR
ncbi:MAG: SurA N-terminal domain-containing protein, partial [Acidobacteriota bacterium]